MEMEISEKVKKRQETNRELLKKLGEFIEEYPQQRWGQILFNYGFLPAGDPFYEESVDTLKRVDNIQKMP